MSRQKNITLNRKQKFALSRLSPDSEEAVKSAYKEGVNTFAVVDDKTYVWWPASFAWLPYNG